MALVSAPPSPIFQTTGGAIHLADRLNELLGADDLPRLRIAVSYVRWSGLGILASRIEGFLNSGGELQTLYGVANGVTTPDGLLYSLYLQTLYPTYSYAGIIEDQYQNATFHPKFFEFKFKQKTVAIVRSGNFTAGGLVSNTEIALQIEFANGDPLRPVLDDAWKSLSSFAHKVTLSEIRRLKAQEDLGSEQDREPGHKKGNKKPFIVIGKKTAKKPLYLKILDVKEVQLKNAFIGTLDVVTDRPKRLYLQILKYETGAQTHGAGAGYQVQLPVATLAAFFGVAPNQTQKVSFHFGSDVIAVNLTHFGNNTDRVRLSADTEYSPTGDRNIRSDCQK